MKFKRECTNLLLNIAVCYVNAVVNTLDNTISIILIVLTGSVWNDGLRLKKT